MKKSLPLLLPLLLLGVLSACHYEKRIPKETTLTIEVVNRKADSPRGLRVMFCDPVFQKRITDTLDSEGKFSTRTVLMVPQNHSVRYDNQYIYFFVEPGDSVHIRIDEVLFDERHRGVTFGGAQAEINRQLELCNTHLALLDFPWTDASKLDVPADSVIRMVEQEIQLRKDTLHAYAAANDIAKEVVLWMEKDITYTVANLYVDYKAGDRTAQGRADRYALHCAPVFNPAREKLFTTMNYAPYLHAYCQALVEAKLPEKVLAGEALPRLKAACELVASHEKATLCRDYMLYSLIWDARREANIGQLLPELNFMFTNAYFPDQLTQQMREEKEREASRPASIPVQLLYLRDGKAEELPRQDFFECLKNAYPGKVVCIDFFATWCGPCMQEFATTTPELQRLYAKKEVVFVNLCMASELPDWQPTLRKQRIRGENYYVNQVDTEHIHRIHRTGKYPSHLLMDHRGEVADVHSGTIDLQAMCAKIDALLAQPAD